MFTYCISRIKLIKDINANIFFHSLSKKNMPRGFQVKLIQKGENPILKITEKVPVTYNYIKDEIITDLDTQITFIRKKKNIFLISSPRGIGIIVKGRPRQYIDNIISKILLRDKNNIISITPHNINQKKLRELYEKEKITSISLNVSQFGKFIFRGKKIEKDQLEKTCKKILQDGEIEKIRCYNNSINRSIEFRSEGTLRSSISNIKVIGDIIQSLLF